MRKDLLEEERMGFDVVDEGCASGAKIRVIGVGGAGCNALNNMVEHGLKGVEFIAVNTDRQSLNGCREGIKRLQIGEKVTGGLGAGSNPEVGKRAAEESEAEIIKILEGADMVFVTAGMGGGTGTGAAPVIAGIAKQMGILTVAVVTKPFWWEMKPRILNAERGIQVLQDNVDAMIVIQNDRVVDNEISMIDAFKRVDDVLRQGVQGITDIINLPGYINADFNDIKSILINNRGMALMAIAEASGENRSEEVVKKALDNPLLENKDIRGAKGILYNVTSGKDFKIAEWQRIGELIKEEVGDDASLIFGWVLDEEMKDSIRLTIIATGFNNDARNGGFEVARARGRDPEERVSILEDSLNDAHQRLGRASFGTVEDYASDGEVRIPKFLKLFDKKAGKV